MKKILIPTDFSENAMNAINYAIALFKDEFCRFYIMHSYDEDIYNNKILISRETLNEITKIAGKNSQIQLKKVLKQIKKLSPNVKHKFIIISANNILVDEADTIVDERDIDLIVMGTLGKTNNKKLTFGSHTLQVLKYVKCPVLGVPENCKFKVPENILFATDYNVPHKERELDFLAEISKHHQSKIHLLYISDDNELSLKQEDNLHFIKKRLAHSIAHFIATNEKNMTKTIQKYIKNRDTDILVMVNRRHSFLEQILFQDTVDKISLSVNIPFLAFQNMNRN